MKQFVLCTFLLISGCQNSPISNQTQDGRGSGFCYNCRYAAAICDLGKCQRCGQNTMSSAFDLCEDCGRQEKRCISCQSPLQTH